MKFSKKGASRTTRFEWMPCSPLLLDLAYGMTYGDTQGGILDGQVKERNLPRCDTP